MMAIPVLLALALTPDGCHKIQSDMIFARDVAAVFPAFAQVPGDFPLGYLLTSGEPRILRGVDLQRIAKNQRLELDGIPDVCFARETFVPQAGQLREAMLAELNFAGAKIEVLSWSQHPASAGELVFPRSGLQLPPGSAVPPEVLWHGYVRYSGDREFPVWARVRITANHDSSGGGDGHCRGQANSSRTRFAWKPTKVLRWMKPQCTASMKSSGYLSKSSLHAGSPIRKTQIERAPDVARGDLVIVQVIAGGAHLRLEARAETAGATGSTILVRNLSSGKDFRAQVTGKDAAEIQ